MLNRFRALEGSIWAKFLLAFLVLSFGIWGVGDMLRRPAGNQSIATVGDQTISAEEFVRAQKREMENLRGMLGDHYSPELVKSLGVGHQVLRKLFDQALLKEESETLALIPGDADVVRHIRSNPAFQDSKGNFDKSIFLAMLKNLGISEKTYVDKLRQDMAANLLMDALVGNNPVHDMAVRTMAETHEQQRNISLYVLGAALVSNLPEPDDAQLETYYKAHAADFTAPEYRTISYVSLSNSDIHEKPTASDEALRAAYKERIEEFKKPEKRVVEQLLYNNKDKADKAYGLIQGGKSVTQTAKEMEPLNKNSLSLGAVEHNNIIETAADSVFALQQGETTPPIQSAFGWHVFHVSKIEPPAITSFEEARPILEKDSQTKQADDALNKMATKLEDALAGGSTLPEAAHELGLKVVTLAPVNHQGLLQSGAASKEIPSYDKFLDIAFKAEEKTDSGLVTAKGGVYYLLHVDSVMPEHLHSLEEVKAQAISGWQSQERAKRLGELAQIIATGLAKNETRNATIDKYNLQPTTTASIKRSSRTANAIAIPQALVEDVFSHMPDEGTNAYPLKDNTYGVAVVKAVLPVSFAGKDANNVVLDETRQTLQNNAQSELIDQYMHYLAGKYKISVNEPLFKSLQ